MATNESTTSHRKVVQSSDRSFGFVFAAVFAIVALLPLLSGRAPRLWAGAVAVALLVLAFSAPWLLAPLNRFWYRFGLALHHIVNPLIMGLVYFGAVVPTGLVVKLMRKDLLRLARQPDAESYWIRREPPGPDPRSMSKQF